jgi:hypothetical protein
MANERLFALLAEMAADPNVVRYYPALPSLVAAIHQPCCDKCSHPWSAHGMDGCGRCACQRGVQRDRPRPGCGW